jgi:hypothetical protein
MRPATSARLTHPNPVVDASAARRAALPVRHSSATGARGGPLKAGHDGDVLTRDYQPHGGRRRYLAIRLMDDDRRSIDVEQTTLQPTRGGCDCCPRNVALPWCPERTVPCWRRGRDSNPRYGYPYAAFRVRCFQPLSHLSARRARGRCLAPRDTAVLINPGARNKRTPRQRGR